MSIIIQIKTDGELITDLIDKKQTNLQEVAITLLRLKQIEQQLIDIEFDDDINIEK